MAPIDWDAVPVLVRRSNLQVQDNAYDINRERMSLKFVISKIEPRYLFSYILKMVRVPAFRF